MIAVITGDIINSRKAKEHAWLKTLKEILKQYGRTPGQWEIFRGDSFQISLAPQLALKAALHIKAGIKQYIGLDVRIGIGIGEGHHQSEKITEASGTAFIRSGECFESLKKYNLAINSGNTQIDEQLNLMIALALRTMNNWRPIVAKSIKTNVEHPEKNQKDIANMLKKSQSSISEGLKRGAFDEIMQMEKIYRNLIQNL